MPAACHDRRMLTSILDDELQCFRSKLGQPLPSAEDEHDIRLLIETVGEFPYQNRLEDIHDSWEKVADAVNQYFGVPGHNMNGQQARKRVEYLLQWHRDLERQEPLEDENFVPDYDEKRQLLTDLDDVLDNFELDREAVELGTMSKSESKTLCSDRGNYFKDCSLGEGLRRAAIAEMAKRARLMSEGQF